MTSWNAKHYQAIRNVWSNIIDQGNPITAPDYPMDIPFVFTFTASGLGTNEVVQDDNRLQIFPNPLADNFIISNSEKN